MSWLQRGKWDLCFNIFFPFELFNLDRTCEAQFWEPRVSKKSKILRFYVAQEIDQILKGLGPAGQKFNNTFHCRRIGTPSKQKKVDKTITKSNLGCLDLRGLGLLLSPLFLLFRFNSVAGIQLGLGRRPVGRVAVNVGVDVAFVPFPLSAALAFARALLLFGLKDFLLKNYKNRVPLLRRTNSRLF